MQSVLSRIWTHVTMSISYDDNHYTTGTSLSSQLSVKYVVSLLFFYKANFDIEAVLVV